MTTFVLIVRFKMPKSAKVVDSNMRSNGSPLNSLLLQSALTYFKCSERGLMNDEFKRMWKKTQIGDFRYRPRIYLQMLARSIKINLVIPILVENKTDHLTSTNQKHCNWS